MKKFAGDIINLHMCTKNHTHMGYISWDTKWDRIFCHFGPFFAFLPHPPDNTENQNFEEMKKAFEDVIILNLCNKKHDHKMHAYSDMECSHRHNFLSFQTIFCSFAPLLIPKINIWKKSIKTPRDIILLHMCTMNQNQMYPWYDLWFLRYEVQLTIFLVILGNCLPFYPPNSPKNDNIKNEKKSAILFQRCGARRM